MPVGVKEKKALQAARGKTGVRKAEVAVAQARI